VYRVLEAFSLNATLIFTLIIKRGGAILTPNELVLTFRSSYGCANFGENWSRNATVRVLADGQTHTQKHAHTDTQTQTDFIICPMLYAINVKNDVYKNGYRQRSCTSKTAKIHRFI